MWEKAEPLLPPRQGNGRPWNDHRLTVEGICCRLRTGCPWRDLPGEFGPWQSVWRRFDAWAKDGTWDKILKAVAPGSGATGLVAVVDGTVARAHKHAGGAQEKGAVANYKKTRGHKRVCGEPADHGLGHSRGGWTTKAHVAVDGAGHLVSVVLTAGQAGENPRLFDLVEMAGARVEQMVADRAYPHPSTRRWLRRKKIKATIPEKSDQIAGRKGVCVVVVVGRVHAARSTVSGC
jgi:transposase